MLHPVDVYAITEHDVQDYKLQMEKRPYSMNTVS